MPEEAPCWGSGLGAPIFAPLAGVIGGLPPDRFPGVEDLNALAGPALASAGGAPIRFVAPGDGSDIYEVRVYERGEVATRPDNWHDLFNALVWLTFPKTKSLLNSHHYRELAARRGELQRGTARDVLTLFDEGGVIVAVTDAKLSLLLSEGRWKELFWEHRAQVSRSMRFCVFGHAIYEKALQPYKGVTAKALILDATPGFLDWPMNQQLAELDARTARYFSAENALASTRTLPPLPILGIPGWDAANGAGDYYDDTGHFRPRHPRIEPAAS